MEEKNVPDKPLTASEALFGFVGWITTREEAVTASFTHNAAVWADLVREYCRANDLAEPRENWHANLSYPFEG